MNGAHLKRGALIVLEGCDRAGKSTQSKLLVEKLWAQGVTAQLLRFPDRTTATGRIIDGYLTKKEQMPDQAIHLLFSANRWECEPKMKKLLNDGVTLVVDRYSFSGVAYTAAKSGLDYDWARNPETGLLKPDLVFLLSLESDAISKRGGYGDEVYDNKEFQAKVFENFQRMKDDTFRLVNAELEIPQLHEIILKDALTTIGKVQKMPLTYLW